jgi:hypothetical protein
LLTIINRTQDFFAANPQFAQRFPGGIVEFANIAAQMPEDALEDLMVAVVNDAEDGQLRGEGRMPGQMPGEDIFDDIQEPPAGFDGEIQDEEGLVDLEDDEEGADEEELEEEQVAVCILVTYRFSSSHIFAATSCSSFAKRHEPVLGNTCCRRFFR